MGFEVCHLHYCVLARAFWQYLIPATANAVFALYKGQWFASNIKGWCARAHLSDAIWSLSSPLCRSFSVDIALWEIKRFVGEVKMAQRRRWRRRRRHQLLDLRKKWGLFAGGWRPPNHDLLHDSGGTWLGEFVFQLVISYRCRNMGCHNMLGGSSRWGF